MTAASGLELTDSRALPELSATAQRLLHTGSGAEILRLDTDDPNHVFGIAFRTLPGDSTGVPHILEHSVLCGSRAFPVAKPFVELLKGSMQTFLNAMTLPDLTMYAVASPNARDFRNLVEVYLDAVFHPLLTDATFRQEAWRLERDAEGQPLLQGVVYNEMKGYLASPRNALDEAVRRALLPGTIYANGFGGDPAAIPDLTPQAWRAFHRRFYVGRNALVFYAGPGLPDEVLALITGALDQAPAGETPDPVPDPAGVPEAAATPRHVKATYPGQRATPRRDGMVGLGWTLSPDPGRRDRLAWRLFERLVTDAPQASLRKALVEGGLGEDLVLSGFSDWSQIPTFRVGLMGADPAAAEEVERTVLEVLARHADEGFDPADVAAALDTLEFALREGPAGPMPQGIRHFFDALKGWGRSGDPLATIGFETALAELRKSLSEEAFPLRDMARHLLDDPRRVTVVLEADPEQAAREAGAERDRIACIAADPPPEPSAGDPPASPDVVPMLSRADLPRDLPPDPPVSLREALPVLEQQVPARGIVHVDLAFDLTALPDSALPLARFLGVALTETGTRRLDAAELARRIDARTGGIFAMPWVSARVGGGHVACLILRGKALAARVPDLCALMGEVITDARLDDATRLRELLRRELSRTESALVGSGHEVIDRRLRAGLSAAGRADEAMNGTGYLHFLRAAAEDAEGLAQSLSRLRDQLPRPLVSLAARPADLSGARGPVDDLLAALARPASGLPASSDAPSPGTGNASSTPAEGHPADPAADPASTGRSAGTPEPTKRAEKRQATAGPQSHADHPQPDATHQASPPTAEALELPSQVNYVGLGGDLTATGLPLTGATEAAVRHLAGTWLWDEVRVRGGAYGGLARLDPVTGILTFLSYRDPNLLATLDTYRRSADILRAGPSDRDLTASIIATTGTLDRPRPPGLAALDRLQRHLTGQSRAWRATRRAALLETAAADFHALGEAIAHMPEHVVVMGGPEALDRADQARPGWLTRSRLL